MIKRARVLSMDACLWFRSAANETTSPGANGRGGCCCGDKKKPPRTALVLGGGGSRGTIAVGLYQALVELGIRIDMVVSSSIGAVNGALIASGLSPAQLEDSWRAIPHPRHRRPTLAVSAALDRRLERVQQPELAQAAAKAPAGAFF